MKTAAIFSASAPAAANSTAFNIAALIGFIGLALLAPLASAGINPRSWYPDLAKPVWAPPAWIFNPVWTLLYAAMASQRGVSGGGVAWSPPLVLWFVQLALNAAWTPIFLAYGNPAGCLRRSWCCGSPSPRP